MATDTEHSQRAAGLPDPDSIIEVVNVAPQHRVGVVGEAHATQAYRIIKTTEMDPYDLPPNLQEAGGIGALEAAPPVPSGDAFHGTSRKAAKLSIGTGNTENFADVQDLLASLPADQSMINHHPPISDTASSTRATEEKRNIRVRAFLYAAKRETDNDFHLIIGRDRRLAPHLYMTMELSGLPTHSSGTYNTLKAARDAFKQYFGIHLPGTRYEFYDPPRPVVIEGSLLFDIHHATGPHPGPPSLGADMPTIWEVHPITSITFEA